MYQGKTFWTRQKDYFVWNRIHFLSTLELIMKKHSFLRNRVRNTCFCVYELTFFWFLVAVTQLALQSQQERIQVVRSNNVVRRLPTESNSTPAMELELKIYASADVQTRKELNITQIRKHALFGLYYYHLFFLSFLLWCITQKPILRPSKATVGRDNNDNDCFYYFQQYFSTLDWGSM